MHSQKFRITCGRITSLITPRSRWMSAAPSFRKRIGASVRGLCPKETYDLRMSLSSRKRAFILATLYEILWMLPFSNPSAGERKEILESILEHPDVWLSFHQSSFIQLFGKLERLASIQPGLPEIDSLRITPNEEVRNRIHEYIASQL